MPSSTSSDELPRFAMPGEPAEAPHDDASDAAETTERPALRSSRPSIRRVRPSLIAREMSADATDEIELDQILLEAYVEPPPPKRASPAALARPEPHRTPRPFFPPAPSVAVELAEVDAFIERSASPPSVAPFAVPIPQPPIYVQDAPAPAPGRVGTAVALAGVFVLAAAASFTLLARPETLGRIRGALTPHGRTAAAAAPATAPASASASAPGRATASATATAPARAPASASASASASANKVASAVVPTVAVEALPKPVVDAGATLVTLPAYARGHRVFVDGVTLPTSAATFKTRCGRHAIQIGSSGKGRALDLPCGGELVLR